MVLELKTVAYKKCNLHRSRVHLFSPHWSVESSKQSNLNWDTSTLNRVSNFDQKQPAELFFKKSCSINFCKIHRETPVLKSLFNKVAGLRPATSWKRDSDTGVFLWILRNFLEHLFWSISANDCFCSMVSCSRFIMDQKSWLPQECFTCQTPLHTIYLPNTRPQAPMG